MRLCQLWMDKTLRIGVAVGEHIVDINAALKDVYRAKKGAGAGARNMSVPNDMIEFLKMGREGMRKAKEVELYSKKLIKMKKSLPGYFYSAELTTLAAPIRNPRKIICIGANYRDHCKESGLKIPKSPVIFAKYPTAIIGPEEPILLPQVSKKVDYEAELAFIIGKVGKNISRARAYTHVAGYTIFNDVSARDLQFSDGQWVRGKTPDTFAPIGPYLVTRDEVPDPHKLKISLSLNGKIMQDSTTKQIIFAVPYLVAFLSQVITLEVGDIVSTGTPPGVGAFRNPPVFLKPNDSIEITIEKLGTLRNSVKKGR